MKYHVVGVIIIVTVAVLLKMETDTSTFSAVQSAMFNTDHRDLFKFVAQWFQRAKTN